MLNKKENYEDWGDDMYGFTDHIHMPFWAKRGQNRKWFLTTAGTTWVRSPGMDEMEVYGYICLTAEEVKAAAEAMLLIDPPDEEEIREWLEKIKQ